MYWEATGKPRVFGTVTKPSEIKKLAALGIPEGGCKTVGDRTYMRLPDKPILALHGGDSILQPAPEVLDCSQSDIKF